MPSQWFGANLSGDPNYQSLVSRVSKLESRLLPVSSMAYAQQSRRFRLAAVTTLALVSAGGTVSVNVAFSSPMPTSDYKVDVAVPALAGAVSNIAVTNPTLTGCTVTFTIPSSLALGATVIVLAISPPSNS